MRLVFFGTPDFAVPSLRALVGEGFDVAAVVTQPDKPHGRSRSSTVPPPVKVVALEEGLTVLQPPRPNEASAIDQVRRIEPQLGIVVAYGHILKPELLSVPPRGMLNVHASLLPELRGAAPIQHAILRGHETTGVSIMRMEAGMDTGPVLLRVPTPIASDETFGELHSRLAETGALALIEALTVLEVGQGTFAPQDADTATYAPKITREMTRIDWTRSALDIHRQVRAYDPVPGAWTELDGRTVKLFGPTAAEWPAPTTAPGTIAATDGTLVVATGEGALRFDEVQAEGKKRTRASDWLRGRTDRSAPAFT